MEYTNPYLAEALDEKKNMDAILSDPAINNSEKQTKYQEAINNYLAYIKKVRKSPCCHSSALSNSIKAATATSATATGFICTEARIIIINKTGGTALFQ